MTLTVADQLNLLHDLLDEQILESSGSVSEYQQIKRLVKTLIATNNISDEQMLQLLPEIYHYGLKGEVAQSLSEHITTNKENIETWKNAIQQVQLE